MALVAQFCYSKRVLEFTSDLTKGILESRMLSGGNRIILCSSGGDLLTSKKGTSAFFYELDEQITQ